MPITHSMSDVLESRTDTEDGRKTRIRERVARSSSCSSNISRGLSSANFVSEDEEAPLICHLPPETPSMSRDTGDLISHSESIDSLPGEYLQGLPMAIHLGVPIVSGGAVQRMWEGDLFDCLENPKVTAQTAICPCLTFGQNMQMAGFGDCSVQALLFFLVTAGIFLSCQVLALYTATGFMRWLSVFLFMAGTGYGAYHRMEMRRKFNIHGSDFSDYVYHGFCSCCALCQEGRTLQVNNVHNGIWSGRGNNLTTVGQPFSITVVPSSPFSNTIREPRESREPPFTIAYTVPLSPHTMSIREGTGREEMGRVEKGWDETGKDGKGWEETGREETGRIEKRWEEKGRVREIPLMDFDS